MTKFAVLILCAQALLVQNVFGLSCLPYNQIPTGGCSSCSSCGSLVTGYGGSNLEYTNAGYGNIGYGNVGCGNVGIGNIGCGSNIGYANTGYGGVGIGEFAAVGELPVAGPAYIDGSLPVCGGVQFNGNIPAGGLVSIAGNTPSICGCNNGGYAPFYGQAYAPNYVPAPSQISYSPCGCY